jgi:FdhD protein
MNAVRKIKILSFLKEEQEEKLDVLAVEDPLEIRIQYGVAGQRITKNISITMRTPGNDSELAIGFLLTEGIIKSITEVESCTQNSFEDNIITVSVHPGVQFDISKLDRHFYTSSSCGVCGKSSVDSVHTIIPEFPVNDLENTVSLSVVYSLNDKLRNAQNVFNATGGLHASGLFNLKGELILLREDVGRHNALDKLIGAAGQAGLIPLNQHILLLSGRASFELIQKAAMAGIKIIIAIGAPSSLALELAMETGITLIGFLRGEKFNLYCRSQDAKFVS